MTPSTDRLAVFEKLASDMAQRSDAMNEAFTPSTLRMDSSASGNRSVSEAAGASGRKTGNSVDDYLFTTPTGTPLRGSNFRNGPLRKAVLASGVTTPVTPYTFRHTAASLLAKASVPASTAAAMLGHDPAVFLRTYAHLYPEDLRVAADALERIRTGVGSGSGEAVATSERLVVGAPAGS